MINQQLTDFLRCPLSMQIMFDPVIAEDNKTYEREEIEKYFSNCENNKKNIVSPMDNKTIITNKLMPNDAMRSMIQQTIMLNPNLKEEVYFSESIKTTFMQAMQHQRNDQLKPLLEKEPRLLETQFNKKSILLFSCEHGNIETINIIAEKLKEANRFAFTDELEKLLIEFIQNQKLTQLDFQKFVKQILQLGSSVIADFFNKIVISGHIGLAKAFIQSELININTQLDANGNTPLHVAVSNNHYEMAKQLVKIGAKVKQCNNQNQTSISIAEISNNQALAGKLLLWHRKKKFEPLLQKQKLKMELLNKEIEELKGILVQNKENNRREVLSLGNSIQTLFQLPIVEQAIKLKQKQLSAKEQEIQNNFVEGILQGNMQAVQNLYEFHGALMTKPDINSTYPLLAAIYSLDMEMLKYVEHGLGSLVDHYWAKITNINEIKDYFQEQQPELRPQSSRTPQWLVEWYERNNNKRWSQHYLKEIKPGNQFSTLAKKIKASMQLKKVSYNHENFDLEWYEMGWRMPYRYVSNQGGWKHECYEQGNMSQLYDLPSILKHDEIMNNVNNIFNRFKQYVVGKIEALANSSLKEIKESNESSCPSLTRL